MVHFLVVLTLTLACFYLSIKILKEINEDEKD